MNGFALWVLGAVFAFTLGVGVANLWIAERDERRWRRDREQQARDLIIQKYSQQKGEPRGI